MHGRGSIAHSSASSVVNDGVISADVSGQTLTISTNGFTNNGTTEAINGGILNIDSATWSSAAGTLNVDSSTLNLAGSFTTAGIGTVTRTGGTINLTGTLTNTGDTLTLNATTGSWRLLGGTVVGGTVAFADGESFLTTTSGGTFNGVTLDSDLTIDNNHSLTVDNGFTLNAVLTLASSGSTTDLRFVPADQTLGGTGEVVLGGTSSNNRLLVGFGGAMTLTIGADIEVHGRGSIAHSSASSVVNDGVISADVSGQTLTISTNGLTNNGTLEAAVGAIMNITSATPTLNGTIKTTIAGTASTDFGRFTIGSAATLSGTLEIALSGGFVPLLGQTFQIMTYGSRTGAFSFIVELNDVPGLVYDPVYNALDLTLNLIAG